VAVFFATKMSKDFVQCNYTWSSQWLTCLFERPLSLYLQSCECQWPLKFWEYLCSNCLALPPYQIPIIIKL